MSSQPAAQLLLARQLHLVDDYTQSTTDTRCSNWQLGLEHTHSRGTTGSGSTAATLVIAAVATSDQGTTATLARATTAPRKQGTPATLVRATAAYKLGTTASPVHATVAIGELRTLAVLVRA